MSLQARMSANDPRLYNPSRDVAHCFGGVMTEVAKRVEAGSWGEIETMLKAHQVSPEDVGKTCQCLCRFVASQMDIRGESMHAPAWPAQASWSCRPWPGLPS